ncbi:MAG TPA: hypothetical protein DDX98_07050 [Bacteroidales bacterium]|jgi:hypothetical protein|nr:hypothetical protein [Bacteroidales bacterium]
MNNRDKTTEVFSGTMWEAELVKSLLTDYEIDCFLKHNVITSYALEPIQADNVKVIVLEKNKQMAEQIVEEFYRNMR